MAFACFPKNSGVTEFCHTLLSVIYAGAIVSCGAWWAMQKKEPDKEAVIEKFSEFIVKL